MLQQRHSWNPCPTPFDIGPSLKACPTKKASGGKKAWKTFILTSTPVKDKLLEEHTRKNEGKGENPPKKRVRKQTLIKKDKKGADSTISESDTTGSITKDDSIHVGRFMRELTGSNKYEITFCVC